MIPTLTITVFPHSLTLLIKASYCASYIPSMFIHLSWTFSVTWWLVTVSLHKICCKTYPRHKTSLNSKNDFSQETQRIKIFFKIIAELDWTGNDDRLMQFGEQQSIKNMAYQFILNSAYYESASLIVKLARNVEWKLNKDINYLN